MTTRPELAPLTLSPPLRLDASKRAVCRLDELYRRTVFVERLAGRALGYDSGDFVIVEWRAEVGSHWIAPLHVHHRDDEAWVVLEGVLGFVLDGDQLEAPAGSAVLAPCGTAHTYRNAGPTEARYVLVTTPKIARLIAALHEPGADPEALFAAHDSELLRRADAVGEPA